MSPPLSADRSRRDGRPIDSGALSIFAVTTLVLLASLLLPLPAHDGLIAHVPPLCPFYALTGLPCPGCGLTRAFVCITHGHFAESLHWNLLGLPIFAICILIWARAGATLALRRAVVPVAPVVRDRLGWITLAVLLTFGLVRIALIVTGAAPRFV